jgi:hypothetical protein
VTRWGDERWQLIVRWVLNAQIAAEALGVTSKNVDEMKAKSTSSEVRRLLGVEGKFGDMMGISNDWAYNIVKQVGNYGESYERTVGMGSALKLKRGSQRAVDQGRPAVHPAVPVIGRRATSWRLPLAAAPVRAVAAQAPVKLGWLSVSEHPFVKDYRERLRELGLVEGRNLVIEYRYARATLALLPAGRGAGGGQRRLDRGLG